MYRNFFLLSFLFFLGCSTHQPTVGTNNTKPIAASKKVFEEEDTYIMYALRAQQIHNYEAAAKLYKILYEKAHKKEYLYQYLESALLAKEYSDVVTMVDAQTDNNLSDPKLIRLKILALYNQGKLNEATKLALALAHTTQSVDDYILVSDIYIKNSQYELALKYLDGAYVKEYNEKILDKMAIILYSNLHKTKDAIAQLETHSRIHGCSKVICGRLLSIYSNENDVDGLLRTYKRLYNNDKDPQIAKKIVEIYRYKRDFIGLMEFLEKNRVDNELLLQLYVSAKNYKDAATLAYKLYKETADLQYLGQGAIYEYEANQENLSKKRLYAIVTKLKQVANATRDPLYLNYLGYILIDHEIDIQQGIKYVKEVLKVQPDSAYYLDSLAWGYYKLGKCKKALKLIQRVVTLEYGNDPEVLYHKKEIEHCIKNPHYKKAILKR